MKLKDFSGLDAIYQNISNTKHEPINQNTTRQEVLLTDASIYLPESKAVKAGSPLGGGPGAKGDEVTLPKKTGPEGLKGNNFEKVSKQQDPGTDAALMKKEEQGDNEESEEKENVFKGDAAKLTTPNEKVRESTGESNKYSYQPKFTMSKLKFDRLYEDAIKRIPFTENADEEAGMKEAGMDADAPVAPTDDVAADSDLDMGGDDVGSDDITLTIDRDTARKLCDMLQAQLDTAGDDEGVDAIDLDGVTPADTGDEVVAEEVEAEDEGHPLHNQKKGKPDSPKSSNQVGDLKKSGGTADKGTLKSEPEPKELGDKSGPLKGKSNKVGSGTVATAGKKIFD